MALNLSRNTKVYVSSANGVHASGGSIKTVTVTTAGSGHAVGDVVSFAADDTSANGVNAKVIVAAVDGSGGVTKVNIPNNFRGSLFAANETLTQGDASDSTGSGTGLVVTVATVGDTTVDGSRIATGLFKGNGTNANTFRVGVLDGYSFSQGSDATDVVINEAGATPNRGQKRFNDSLPPAEWSFSTYVRPYKHGTNSPGTSGNHDMVENILWAAIAGKDITGGSLSGTSAAAVTVDATDADISFVRSEHHELLKLSIFFALENTTYRLNECQVNQCEIDFSIDGIATLAWSGNATTIDQITNPIEDPNTAYSSLNSDTGGAYSANATINNAEGFNYVDCTGPDDADYLRNKLSTLTLAVDADQGGGASSNGLTAKTYDIAITGGSITIANNITYVTPETLGIIDKPIGSFSGARQITGSLTMYLNTTGSSGSGNGSNQLLSDLANATDLVRNEFNMSLFMGGASSDTPVVEFDIPKAHLQVPAIEVADLISVSVEFAAHGSNILTGDEMTVKYKGLTSHSDATYASNLTV